MLGYYMDKGLHDGVIFCDIKKAFNAVDNYILLSKLRKYDTEGLEFEWFKSYLTDRKQSCTRLGDSSSFKMVLCGVPQGSCLGPLLTIDFWQGCTVHVCG